MIYDWRLAILRYDQYKLTIFDFRFSYLTLFQRQSVGRVVPRACRGMYRDQQAARKRRISLNWWSRHRTCGGCRCTPLHVHSGLLDHRKSVVPFKAGEKRSMETSLFSDLLLAKDARNIIGQYLFTERLAVHQPHLLVGLFQSLLRDEFGLHCSAEQHFQQHLGLGDQLCTPLA